MNQREPYLIGTIGATIAANVPRNDALAALDPAAASSATRWATYVSEWTASTTCARSRPPSPRGC